MIPEHAFPFVNYFFTRAVICILSILLSVFADGIAMAEKPNMILIMADDLGYGDLSCYGNEAFETPRLDQMATEGLRFTDFHSSGPVCSPTRAGLMTGRYQQRSGIPGVIYASFEANRHHGLFPSEITFPELVQQAGYQTAMFGKWHLGYREKFNPIHHGFQKFRGYVSGNIDYHSHIDRMGVFDWWNGDRLENEKGYSTTLMTEHALDFVGENKESPFCLYLAYEAPHDPYQGPSDPPIRVEGKVVPNRYAKGQIPRAYREMVQTMDHGIGQVLDLLKALKLDRKTLVFFLSDNGANKNGSNGALRGYKGSLWEGGHRVPAIAWWPSIIPPNCVCDDLSISLDVMPTMMELSGAVLPGGHLFDGVSLVSAFRRGYLPDRSRKVFWAYGEKRAMRDGPWKLLVDQSVTPSIQLFHLGEDVSEQKNLYNNQLLKSKRMLSDLEVWHEGVLLKATTQPHGP
ncbi:MAG: sulfatase-like hydrolase/transferase [Verrucomicrobia bacterium]|jgi:arylsulfatase A|nr:sulfatase-like hydrolase/transferase [Verrucomicrobiota bacterium]